MDLDDPTSEQSLTNLNLGGMRLLDGDQVDDNPDFALSKLVATQTQNNVNLITFWTECLADPVCPAGFKQLTLGHGKVIRLYFYCGHLEMANACLGL